jgi:uncharacterized protein (TIGR02118 family)
MSDAATPCRVVALHRAPADVAAYEAYYHERHMPLVWRVPGVRQIRVGKVVGTPDDTPGAYWLMSEVFFDDQEALERAMKSGAMAAAMEDVANFAKEGQITIMYCQAEDVVPN